MIAAELALLTAVALFFSTFSSSALLSVVFTVGMFVAGLLSADLRRFGDIVDVPPVDGQLRGGHRLDRAGVLGVRRQGAGRPRPAAAAGFRLADARVRRRATSAAILAAAVALFSRREFK